MSFGPEYVHELQAALNGKFPWRVSKVEGGESWVALRVSDRENDEWFLLSWGSGSAGCCLADPPSVEALKKCAPVRAPLVEALKSRLLKGQILAARQLDFDRVLELEVVRFVAAGFGVRYFLVLEITEPTGNLILLDEERRIQELARHVSPDRNRYRTLLPGHLYAPPPAFEGPLPWELESLTFEDLSRVKGIGRPLIRMMEAHWEERDPGHWLRALRCLYRQAPAEPLTCQCIPKGYFTCFPDLFGESEKNGADGVFAAAGVGVLSPLLTKLRARLLHELDARITRGVKSKERHLDGLLKQLKNNAEAELFRRKGELLLAHIASIPPRADKVTLREWGSDEPPRSDEVLEIALDPNLSPSRNAERYFKKYKKARADPQKVQEEAASLRGAIEELREQRELLDSIEDPLKFQEAVRDVMNWISPPPAKNPKKTRKDAKDKDIPPHLRFEFGGCVILVGLSARGNRYVTFKQATGDDLWLHAHELPGAHVIVKGSGGKEGREEMERNGVLAFAASLAAAHSRGKDALSVQVDYTERRYVRSVPGAAVALVTYVNAGTIRVGPGHWKTAVQTHRVRKNIL